MLAEEARCVAAARSGRKGTEAPSDLGSVSPASPSVLTFVTLGLPVAAAGLLVLLLTPLPSLVPAAFGLKGIMAKTNHPFTSEEIVRVVHGLMPSSSGDGGVAKRRSRRRDLGLVAGYRCGIEEKRVKEMGSGFESKPQMELRTHKEVNVGKLVQIRMDA